VVVHSLGTAGAGLLHTLHQVSPLPESRLAELLYQGPSELAAGLDRESAERLDGLLAAAGLESRILGAEDAFEPGDTDHELAVVVRDPQRMPDACSLVVKLLGVTGARARQILCASPAVLIGRVSANTARAIERRFSALGGVEVDVSRSTTALFDVFLGSCAATDRTWADRTLRELGHPVDERPDSPLLVAGISHLEAGRLWQRLACSHLPFRVLNRDFERFDLRLDRAPDTPEMIAFLAESASMPEEVARRVVSSTPLITHPDVTFHRLAEILERLHALGARATGQLLAFQTFGLVVRKVGELKASARVLETLLGLTGPGARAALRETARIEGPLTKTEASWLQWELRQAGTEVSLELR
jgi:hypothetical protein